MSVNECHCRTWGHSIKLRKFGKFSGHFDGERGQCSLINETNKQTRQTKKIQYLAGKCTGQQGSIMQGGEGGIYFVT